MGFEICVFITLLERYKKRHAIHRSFTERGHFLTSYSSPPSPPPPSPLPSSYSSSSSSSSTFNISAPFSGYGLPDLLSPTFSVSAFLNSDARS
jgi:hypothetical protein